MTSRKKALAEIQKRKELGVWSFVEPAITIGSSMMAEPLAGLAGVAALPFGAEAATKVISGVTNDLTYQPRTEQGKRGLASVGKFMAPVGKAFESASKGAGDFVFDKTGSPGLSAAAYSAPTIALEALGLKGARAIPGRQMKLGDVGSQVTGVGRKEKGAIGNITNKTINPSLFSNFRRPDFDLDVDELTDVGADVKDGFVTLYHRTSKENASKIKNTETFNAKEDGVFFSTSKLGQTEGYGEGLVEVKVPINMLELDDIFDGEAHVRIPLKKAGSINLKGMVSSI
jgi:hypothetical protein